MCTDMKNLELLNSIAYTNLCCKTRDEFPEINITGEE